MKNKIKTASTQTADSTERFPSFEELHNQWLNLCRKKDKNQQ